MSLIAVSLIVFCHVFSVDVFSDTSKEKVDYASPKFIVTLDGVPSPLGNITDCDVELDDVRPPTKVTEASVNLNREPKVSVLHRLQGVVTSSEGVESGPNLYCVLYSTLIRTVDFVYTAHFKTQCFSKAFSQVLSLLYTSYTLSPFNRGCDGC